MTSRPFAGAALVCAALALGACSEAMVPQGSGTTPEQGARYVKRYEYRCATVGCMGKLLAIITYEINGNAVVRTNYSDYRADGLDIRKEEERFAITENTFYMPDEEDWCYRIISSAKCGVLGTITPNAIYLTRMANGQRSRDQSSRVAQDMSPVPRSR